MEVGILGFLLVKIEQSHRRGLGFLHQYRGSDAKIRFHRKLKVEVRGDQELVDNILETLVIAARTGQVGDG